MNRKVDVKVFQDLRKKYLELLNKEESKLVSKSAVYFRKWRNTKRHAKKQIGELKQKNSVLYEKMDYFRRQRVNGMKYKFCSVCGKQKVTIVLSNRVLASNFPNREKELTPFCGECWAKEWKAQVDWLKNKRLEGARYFLPNFYRLQKRNEENVSMPIKVKEAKNA